MKNLTKPIMDIYNLLLARYGSRGWWPGETGVEIIIGAILTQAVAWKNVEAAINNLIRAGALNIASLSIMDDERLADLIKPALYHRQKARKIKAMMHFVNHTYHGNLEVMFADPLEELRERLLNVWGIGPETADSILLYAGNKKIFVIDAYTRRIYSRLGYVDENIAYDAMQAFMQAWVEPEILIYNEYHALLVALGADCCRKSKPRCGTCPISKHCNYLLKLEGKATREVEE